MRNRSIRKQAIVFAVVLVALAGAGLVYAAWTTSGSGSVYAKAGTAQAIGSLDASAAATESLYPGATGDSVLKVSNPNPFPVRVTSVALNGTNADITVDGGHAACGSAITFAGATGLTIDVPAKSGGTNGSVEATLPNTVTMSDTAGQACQGATFTIPVSLTGASHAS